MFGFVLQDNARRKGLFFQRLIATCVVVIFSLSDTARWAPKAYAGQLAGGTDLAPSALTIPQELGRVEESFRGTTDKTILFIQDAHDSLEAQKNIAKIINLAVAKAGVRTVFEEGYEGPVPTDKFFGFIKDPLVKRRASYFLLDKLRVGGAEYAHINRSHDFKLIGVEDLKLYGENIKCYQESSKSRAAIEEDLKELSNRITMLANQYFPKDLKTLLKQKELFGAGKLPMLNYLKELRRLSLRAERSNLMDRRAPSGLAMTVLFAALKNEKSRDLEQFAKHYPAISILLPAQTSRDSKLIKQLNALDSKVVFEEILRLETDVSSSLLLNARDQQVFLYYQGLNLLQKLNRVELTQQEYEAVRDVRLNLQTQKLADFIVSQTGRPLVLSKEWERHIKDAVEFYKIAQKRDQTIDRYVGDFLRDEKENTAVLVFGGFHGIAIKEILRERQISYHVVTPAIEKADKRHQDYYKRLMSDGHHAFEVPFLTARANKPPSIFYSAAIIGGESVAHSELRAITLSVEALGENSDPQLIERRLANFDQIQEAQPPSAETGAVKIRSEIREKRERDWEERPSMGKLWEFIKLLTLSNWEIPDILPSANEKVDYIVAIGASIRNDGSASTHSQVVAERAVQLYRDSLARGRTPKIIFSGGYSQNGVAEAESMKRVATTLEPSAEKDFMTDQAPKLKYGSQTQMPAILQAIVEDQGGDDRKLRGMNVIGVAQYLHARRVISLLRYSLSRYGIKTWQAPARKSEYELDSTQWQLRNDPSGFLKNIGFVGERRFLAWEVLNYFRYVWIAGKIKRPEHLMVSKKMLRHSFSVKNLPRIMELGKQLIQYINSRQIYDVIKESWRDLRDESELYDKASAPYDVMMVFGSGYLDAPKEAARIARELRKQNPNMKVIVVGSYGKDQQMAGYFEVDGKRLSEAEYFAKIMGGLGVPPDLTGKESRNTLENVREARKVVGENGLQPKRIIIVSSLHRRAGPTFTLHYPGETESLEKLGIKDVAIWSPEINLDEWNRDEAIAAIKDASEEVRKIKEYSLQEKPFGITPMPIPAEILAIAEELRGLLKAPRSEMREKLVEVKLERQFNRAKPFGKRFEGYRIRIVYEMGSENSKTVQTDAFDIVSEGFSSALESSELLRKTIDYLIRYAPAKPSEVSRRLKDLIDGPEGSSEFIQWFNSIAHDGDFFEIVSMLGQKMGLKLDAQALPQTQRDIVIDYDPETSHPLRVTVSDNGLQVGQKKYSVVEDSESLDPKQRQLWHQQAVLLMGEIIGGAAHVSVTSGKFSTPRGVFNRYPVYLISEDDQVAGVLEMEVRADGHSPYVQGIVIAPQHRGFGGKQILFRYANDVVLARLGLKDQPVDGTILATENSMGAHGGERVTATLPERTILVKGSRWSREPKVVFKERWEDYTRLSVESFNREGTRSEMRAGGNDTRELAERLKKRKFELIPQQGIPAHLMGIEEKYGLGEVLKVDKIMKKMGPVPFEVGFLLKTENGVVFVKKLRRGWYEPMDTEEAHYLEEYVKALQDGGIRIPMVRQQGNGDLLAEARVPGDGKPVFYTVERYLAGKQIFRDEAGTAQLEAVATELSKIHAIGRKWKHTPTKNLRHYDLAQAVRTALQLSRNEDFLKDMRRSLAPEDYRAVIDILEKTGLFLPAMMNKLPKEPIMSDFNLTNMMFSEDLQEISGIFDLDQIRYAYRFEDFLPSLIFGVSGFRAHAQNAAEELAVMVRAYQKSPAPLSPEEIDLLPYHLLFHAANSILHRVSNMNATGGALSQETVDASLEGPSLPLLHQLYPQFSKFIGKGSIRYCSLFAAPVDTQLQGEKSSRMFRSEIRGKVFEVPGTALAFAGWTEEDVARFLKEYRLGELKSIRLKLHNGKNLSILETDQGIFCLKKVDHLSSRDRAREMLFIADIIHQNKRKGIPIPVLYRSGAEKPENLFFSVSDKAANPEEYFMVEKWIDEFKSVYREDATPEMLDEIVRWLAASHVATADVSEEQWRGLDRWTRNRNYEQMERSRQHHRETILHAYSPEGRTILYILEEVFPKVWAFSKKFRRRPINSDMNIANCFFDSAGKIRAITDWADVRMGHRMEDFTSIIFRTGHPQQGYALDHLEKNLIQALSVYQRSAGEKGLTSEEIDMLPGYFLVDLLGWFYRRDGAKILGGGDQATEGQRARVFRAIREIRKQLAPYLNGEKSLSSEVKTALAATSDRSEMRARENGNPDIVKEPSAWSILDDTALTDLLLQVAEKNNIRTDHARKVVIPALAEATSGRPGAFRAAIAMAIRLAEKGIPFCSCLEFGVPFALSISNGDRAEFDRNLLSIEDLAGILWQEGINPYRTLVEGQDALVKFAKDSTSFKATLAVARLIPQWFKSARDKHLSDLKLKDALGQLIAKSDTLETLKEALEVEISFVGHRKEAGEIQGTMRVKSTECTFRDDTVRKLRNAGYKVMNDGVETSAEYEGAVLYKQYEITYIVPEKSATIYHALPFYPRLNEYGQNSFATSVRRAHSLISIFPFSVNLREVFDLLRRYRDAEDPEWQILLRHFATPEGVRDFRIYSAGDWELLRTKLSQGDMTEMADYDIDLKNQYEQRVSFMRFIEQAVSKKYGAAGHSDGTALQFTLEELKGLPLGLEITGGYYVEDLRGKVNNEWRSLKSPLRVMEDEGKQILTIVFNEDMNARFEQFADRCKNALVLIRDSLKEFDRQGHETAVKNMRDAADNFLGAGTYLPLKALILKIIENVGSPYQKSDSLRSMGKESAELEIASAERSISELGLLAEADRLADAQDAEDSMDFAVSISFRSGKKRSYFDASRVLGEDSSVFAEKNKNTADLSVSESQDLTIPKTGDAYEGRSEMRNREEVPAVYSNRLATIPEREPIIVLTPTRGLAPASIGSLDVRAERVVRRVMKSTQPATVFVDAEDFIGLSEAQKQEYLFVMLSNKAVRLVVYNERAELRDPLFDALRKLDRVAATGKNLSGAQSIFGRANAPSIHLSKQILPSQELVQRLRKKISFFKTQGQNGGTLAAALLWAWSGGEDSRLREVSRGQDGFWTVAEAFVNALQRSYENNFVLAVAA